MSVLAKTQFVQNTKTQFENTKTQFENAKTQFENKKILYFANVMPVAKDQSLKNANLN